MMSRLFPLILFVALTGCGKAPDHRVHLRIWHQKIAGERDLFEEQIHRFVILHPEIAVETLYKENEELRNLFVIAGVAGQGPDVIYGPSDNVGVLVTTKTILPLERLFPPAYFQRFLEQGIVSWQGSRWLLADQIGNHLTLVYNKRLVPQPPKTLDELVKVAQALTDRRAGQYGLTWNYREPFFFIPFLTAFGGWVIDEAGHPTLDNEKTVAAIQFVLDLRDKYGVIPKEGDYDTADMLFKENRTAMIINGPWSWSAYHVPERSMVAPLPVNTQTGLWCEPMVSAKGYSVNANVTPDKLTALRELLDYLTSTKVQEEMARKLATTPVDREAASSDEIKNNPALVASMLQIQHGRAIPIIPQMRAIWDGMRGPYQLVMNGAITAREAAHRMQREAEKNIADSSL